MSEDISPYQIVKNNGLFIVQDVQANSILELRDKRNAEHYLTLLNSAYRAGYKAGYRAGKNVSAGGS